MAVWVVVGVIGAGALAAAIASRRHAADVEPTVREFAEGEVAPVAKEAAVVRAVVGTAAVGVDSS